MNKPIFSTRGDVYRASRANVIVMVLATALVLGACGGGGSSPVFTPANDPPRRPANQNPGEVGTVKSGEFYDVTLKSELDNEDIAVTIFEPTPWVVGQGYPLILQGHGYGGSRHTTPDAFITRLREKGYGVISIDQRGFGDSGGEVNALDPDIEGRDLIQLLDYVETELPWLQYADLDGAGPAPNNLVLGSYGGSYGGGYQHLILAIDPQQRLDAIVPDITWHELLYAFAPNLVFKSVFNTLLTAAGESGSQARVAPFIRESFVTAVATNDTPEELQTPFKEFGMKAYCRDQRIPKINAMVWQGIRDTLFNFNEGYWNYLCMEAQGGDVRYFTHQSGHILPGLQAGGENKCGGLDRNESTLVWFDAHLKGQTAGLSTLPEKFCISIAADDAIELDSMPLGAANAADSHDIPPTSLTVGPAQMATDPQIIDLGTVGSDRLLAGIPHITLNISSVAATSAVDPRVFIGLGKQTGGAGDWVLVDDQVLPFRGFGEHVDQLIGVAERYAADDRIGLLVYGWHEYFGLNGSRPGGVVTIDGEVGLPFVP